MIRFQHDQLFGTLRMIAIGSLAIALQMAGFSASASAQDAPDFLREIQRRAAADGEANWIHWGDDETVFSNWTNHSNRLIPVYTFGVSLKSVTGTNSVYRDAEQLEELYGEAAATSVNKKAKYFDQTEIYTLQKQALAEGKKNIILFVCDGLDWQTTQAASIYKNKKMLYKKGRGKGLSFLDYKKGDSEYGAMVTSPFTGGTKFDVNSQTLKSQGEATGGYNASLGGASPWSKAPSAGYLLGKSAAKGHTVNDSAATATAMTTGRKTYKSSINVAPNGRRLKTIAHEMQADGFAIGVVTSVPISHATPACAYAHNVNRNDYQDLTCDLLGVRSISHKRKPLAGVDVLIGCGSSDSTDDDRTKQGDNYVPGNKYLPDDVLAKIDVKNDGKYVVAKRTKGKNGTKLLMKAAAKAAKDDSRLFGFFGGGHLPYQTADGKYDPTNGDKPGEKYESAELTENPKLADMTKAALTVLEKNETGFWLMVESGDIDWSNHNNNIDDAIGAVLSAESAFDSIVEWVEENSSWDETALIFTADHGHMMVLEDPEALTGKLRLGPWVSPLLAEVDRFPRLVTNVEIEMDETGGEPLEVVVGNDHITNVVTESYKVMVPGKDGSPDKEVTRKRKVNANKAAKFFHTVDELEFRDLKGKTVSVKKAKREIGELESFLWLRNYEKPTAEQIALYHEKLIIVSLKSAEEK